MRLPRTSKGGIKHGCAKTSVLEKSKRGGGNITVGGYFFSEKSVGYTERRAGTTGLKVRNRGPAKSREEKAKNVTQSRGFGIKWTCCGRMAHGSNYS